jgi:hypothetical protein
MGTRNKAAKKKAMAKSHSSGKHSKPLFSMADFPDLTAIDKLTQAGDKHPEITVDQLQKVAVERCGIPAGEVTAQLLLAAEDGGAQGKKDGALIPIVSDG